MEEETQTNEEETSETAEEAKEEGSEETSEDSSDSAEDTGQRFRSGALGAAAQRLRLHAVIDVELEARLAAPVAKGLFLGQKYPLNRSNRTEPLTAGSPPRTKAQQRSTEKADFRAE